MGGDLNIQLDPLLDRNDTYKIKLEQNKYRQELLSYMETENLEDIHRIMNPNKKNCIPGQGANLREDWTTF